MINSLNQYNNNKVYVDDLGKLYVLLEQNIPALSPQKDELLRAQIVMAVSAVDTFFHSIIKVGLLQIFNGIRHSDKAMTSYNITYGDLIAINNAQTLLEKQLLLENAIRRINSKDSYQSTTSIEYISNLLGITNIWTKLSPLMGMSSDDIKRKLSLIVRRRNQIAHESDLDFATMMRFPITKADVDDVILFLDQLVNAVYAILQSDIIIPQRGK